MFKSLIGRVHEEISMTKQQDVQEFFAYIFFLSRDRMGKPAVDYSCPWSEAGFRGRRRGCVSRRARIAAFPDIFVVHATNFLHVSGGYSPFNVCHGQGGKPFLEESSHPKGCRTQDLGNNDDIASTLHSNQDG
ncbi:hypothetical protein BU17DRAFT_71720 [Hysterangium stoloniferum]|nr:hypothetical protein BU17DRAFT_71720 [Hysterangium stoloniferum]